MKKVVLSLVTLLSIASASYAQKVSNNADSDFKRWQIRLRGVGVTPNESAKIGVIGGDVNISNQFIPELDITYFFTKHIAAELILGTTKHKVHTVGSDISAIGGPTDINVDLGSVWLLPPTLTAQYHFFPSSDQIARPYVGAGVNYTIFYDVKPGMAEKVKYDNKVAFALQVGSDFDITDNFFLNIDVKYIFLKTDVTVDASNLAGGPLDIPASVKINPLLWGFGVGYRF